MHTLNWDTAKESELDPECGERHRGRAKTNKQSKKKSKQNDQLVEEKKKQKKQKQGLQSAETTSTLHHSVCK